MEVLVTGSKGFIGSRLVKRLQGNGHEVVDILDIIKRDTFDPTPDTIIHCAGRMGYKEPPPTLHDYLRDNTNYVGKILSRIRDNHLTRFIYVSTLSVFEVDQGVITETSRPAPNENYGYSKYMGEILVRASGGDATIVRFPSIYGVGANEGFVKYCYEQAKADKPIELYNQGRYLRHYIHVDDAVEILAYLAGHRSDEVCDVWNIGVKHPQTTATTATMICGMLDSDSEIVPVDKGAYGYDVRIDTAKMDALPPVREIAAGVLDYLEEAEGEQLACGSVKPE